MVIAPFNGLPIRFRDAAVTPVVARSGAYVFRLAQAGRAEQVFQVAGVIGGGHMVGGGTQGFVSRFPDGTLRFLPFDFARQQGVWFCNTSTRAERGWAPITPELALKDCGDWPPVRVLGDEPRFGNCQQCHGSQVEIEPQPGSGYRTRFTSLAINCESCHGPGRRHVELARSGGVSGAAELRIRALGALEKDASLEVCFQCHAVKDALEPGYLPGKELREHYSWKLPLLGESTLFPDGRVRTFAYQEGHLYSDCYRSGSMTCVDCHEPHGQSYRDVNGRPVPERLGDGQCTGCHASKAGAADAHTHHARGSAGSRCVACHMPYLQQPELGHAIRYARSDHTIPIPRPAFDERLGVENACRQCHGDRSTAELEAQVVQWWGQLKPHVPLVSALLNAGQEAAQRLLRPEAGHAAAQFAALATFFEKRLSPDMQELDPATVAQLEELAGSPDVDVRALALASLHLARGDERAVRRRLAEELERAGRTGSGGTVRKRWAVALGFLGDRYRERGEPRRAIVAYLKALELLPGQPRILQNLGQAYAAVGEPGPAIDSYGRSLRSDPNQPLVHVNLGSALAAAGDADGAVAAFRRAVELNPAEPLAYFNLGNLYLRQDRPEQAAPLYRRAAELDPSLALAHFYLARSLILTRDYAGALAAVRQGLEYRPDDAAGQKMLSDLERALNHD